MSNAVNYQDVVMQLEGLGLKLESGLAVGTAKPVRCMVDGERTRKGWYWLHEMAFDNGDVVIVGSYGIWQGSNNNSQKVTLPKSDYKPNKEENKRIRERMAANRKKLAAEEAAKQNKAANKAVQQWRAYAPDGESGYLKRKQVKAYGVRFTPKPSAVVVPMMDASGRIHGLQFILDKTNDEHKEKIKKNHGSDKKFWPFGLKMQGHFHLLGSPHPSGVIMVTEGYATGASIHEATGLPVAVVFNANNILPCIKNLQKHYKKISFLIAADDDYLCRCQACKHQVLVAQDGKILPCSHCGEAHGKINTGISVAINACAAIDAAQWVAPVFTAREGKKWTDFNDLHVQENLQVVASQIDDAVAKYFPNLGDDGLPIRNEVAREPHSGGRGKGKLPTFITVDDAAERFVQVFDVKETIFDRRLHCLLPKSSMIDILPDHGWRELKQHPDRQLVMMEEVGFDPTGKDSSIACNLWGGWPTKPDDSGSCEKLLELLQYMCSEENNPREVYQWVLKWLAYPIQNQGAKMKTALVFHGPQGAGKNVFFEAVMKIYGEYGRVVGNAELETQYNDWASRKLFLIANEVNVRHELFHQKNKLKAFVSDDSVRVNPKNVAAHYESNHMNMVFLSNEIQPVVLEPDDRRYVVVRTPKKRDVSFYGEVWQEFNHGGVAALHQYLLDYDIGDFSCAEMPVETRARGQLIELSKESPLRFVEAWQNDELDVPYTACATRDLYDRYRRWCNEQGERFSYTHIKFSSSLRLIEGLDLVKQYITTPGGKNKKISAVVTDDYEQRRIETGDGKIEALTTSVKSFADALGSFE